MSDDLTQLRHRLAELQRMLDALDAPEGRNAAAYRGQVFDGGAIPTTVPKVFLTHPTGISADEAAGATPTITPGSETVPVLVLGPGVPVAGDNLIARQVDGLWVAAHMGGYPAEPTVALPTCSCETTPEVFTMSSSNTTCDGGMFQPATMRWVSTPSVFAPFFPGQPKIFLSDLTYTDAFGTFRYYFTCSFNTYQLTRAYITNSFAGGPMIDSTRYSWNAAATGNTCVPWLMTVGLPYSGSACPPNILVLTP